MRFHEWLVEVGACEEAREWVGTRGLKAAWNECTQIDWMLWLTMVIPRTKEGNDFYWEVSACPDNKIREILPADMLFKFWLARMKEEKAEKDNYDGEQ